MTETSSTLVASGIVALSLALVGCCASSSVKQPTDITVVDPYPASAERRAVRAEPARVVPSVPQTVPIPQTSPVPQQVPSTQHVFPQPVEPGVAPSTAAPQRPLPRPPVSPPQSVSLPQPVKEPQRDMASAAPPLHNDSSSAVASIQPQKTAVPPAQSAEPASQAASPKTDLTPNDLAQTIRIINELRDKKVLQQIEADRLILRAIETKK